MIHVTMTSALAPNAQRTRPPGALLLRLATLAARAALRTGCVILDLDGTSSGAGTRVPGQTVPSAGLDDRGDDADLPRRHPGLARPSERAGLAGRAPAEAGTPLS